MAISRSNSSVTAASQQPLPTSRSRGVLSPSSQSSRDSDEQNLVHGMNMMVLGDDDDVMQKLANKRKSQLEIRNGAEGVLRKLREKQQEKQRNQKPRGMFSFCVGVLCFNW